MLRKLTIGTIALSLVLLATQIFAGENVVLYDSHGNALKPSQIDSVDLQSTCADCHDDFANRVKQVHFNRGKKADEMQDVNCLDCHLGDPQKAFNSAGEIRKTIEKPLDESCLTCHSVHENDESDKLGSAHKNKSCYDCHKDAGHKSVPAASCESCHEDYKSDHIGFTKNHLKAVSCETCHIVGKFSGEAPGYVKLNGEVRPVDSTDTAIYHGVVLSENALGSKGCTQCHSVDSLFYMGKTATPDTDKNGDPVMTANFKALGLTETDIRSGAVREGVIKPYSIWLLAAVLLACALHLAVFGPRRVEIGESEEIIERFSVPERVFHFAAMFSFGVLAVTGILFLLRFETPGSLLRPIHGVFGPLFIISLIGMLITWLRHARFRRYDIDWVKCLGGYLCKSNISAPAHKFNAGQKLFYWIIVILCGAAISVTGAMLAVGRGQSPSWVYTLHDFSAVILLAGILVHVYLSVFANPGTLMGILSGKVYDSWAKHHHSEWHSEIKGKNNGR